jgi:hypothetical protein
MIRRRCGWVLAMVVTAFVVIPSFSLAPRSWYTMPVAAARQDRQDQPVFRARATAVSLDVSVKRGNRPVVGLTAADFQVTDNGVPQVVEQAFTDAVPIDVTLIIDASGSTAALIDEIRRNAREVLGLLRPDDRARVLIIEEIPYELLPLQRVGNGIVLPRDPPGRVLGGLSSVHDTILAGLVARPDPDRRRLLVAITDGLDNKGVTSVRSLEDVARRSDTVLHVISVRAPTADTGPRLASSPTFRRYQPTKPEMELFESLPALTGGVFHGPPPLISWFGININAVAAIREAIEEFRQSYVIQYTPRDVASGVWHDVVVRVKGIDPRGVRSRAGYFDATP